MVKVQVDESALAHYASQYYDPVKAKEYYERTKKLKGRDEGELSDTQKEAFGYAKTQITEEKQRTSRTPQPSSAKPSRTSERVPRPCERLLLPGSPN